MSRHQAAHLFALVALALAPVDAQGRTLSYNPKHVPPGELQSALGTRDAGGRATIDWMIAGVGHLVEVRRSPPREGRSPITRNTCRRVSCSRRSALATPA